MTLNHSQKLIAGALALVLVAGMTSPAFAGSGQCIVDPSPAEVSLAVGESVEIVKQVSDCGFDLGDVAITNDSDCTSQGIDVLLETTSMGLSLWEGKETITNTGGNPGTTTCVLTLNVKAATGGSDTAFQTVMVTTITDNPVAGELLTLDSSALMIAGLSNTIWMVPAVAGVIGAGVYLIKTRAHRN